MIGRRKWDDALSGAIVPDARRPTVALVPHEPRAEIEHVEPHVSIGVVVQPAPSVQAPQLLEADELATALKLSKHTIYRWGKTGRIPSVRLGRKVRYELDRVLEALRRAPVEEVESPPVRPIDRRARSASRLGAARRATSAPATRRPALSHEERLRAAVEATRCRGD